MIADRKPTVKGPGRALLVLAAIMGTTGVAAAAYASHGTVAQRMAGAVALILLAHAPAILAIALLGDKNRVLTFGGFLIAAGVLLFSADLGLRMFSEARLFANAAPTGGIAMMVGWLVIGGSAFTAWRE